MPRRYTVELVNESEWADRVKSDPRYRGVDDDNLGFSDPQKGRAYVREAAVKNFPGAQAYLLQHEFEHLVSDEPWHEDAQGIRHKKGKDLFRNVAAFSMAPFTGGLSLSAGTKQFRGEAGDIIPNELKGGEGFLGGIPTLRPDQPLGRATKGAAPALGMAALGALGIGGALGGLGKAFFNPGAGGSGAAATAPAGATGNMVSKLLPGQGLLNPGVGGAPLTGQGAMSAFSSQVPGALKLGAQFTGTQAGASAGASLGPQVAQQALQPATGLPQQLGQAALQSTNPTNAPATATKGLASFGLGKNVLGPMAIGTGISALGGLKKGPEMPELGQLPGIQQFRSDVTSKLGPLQSRLQGLSNAALPENMESPIRRQFDKARKNLYSQFASFRPGADLATDSEFRQAMDDLQQKESEAITQAQFGFQGNERQNIMAELGVTEDELQALGSLAQLDVDTIMARTQMSAQEAEQFRQIFGNLGSTISGVGATNSVLNRFGLP